MVLLEAPPGPGRRTAPAWTWRETLSWTLPTPAAEDRIGDGTSPTSNVHPVDANLDYLAHLATESARFRDAIAQAAPDTAVPSCPEWNADDLLWHLGQVQWFWGTVVREHVDGQQAEELKRPRPPGRADLLAFYDQGSRDLTAALAAAAPGSPAWTWSADQTVGFIRRRQAHEALIHRIDAELAAGIRGPVDAQLAADGIDEALRVMYGGVPEWGTFTPDAGQTVRLRATDTGDTWLVMLGRVTGTDPSGTAYDEPDIHPAAKDPGTEAAAGIAGSAADLDCWLWHRPPVTPVQRTGDQQALSRLDATISSGIK